jgi:RimJ/RimL family protein N-acetyltransferase
VPQPTLPTERLLLVPLADRHLELEVELDADPEVLRFLAGRARTRDEVVASHGHRRALGDQVDGLGFWIAFRSPDGAAHPPSSEDAGDFVGLMMLPPAHGPDQPDDPSVCDLGYRLLPRHWRRGFATEAGQALLGHAFDVVGQRLVIAQTMAANRGSRAVMEKLGLRYTRTWFPEWDEPLPDTEQGDVEYEMTREMWRAAETGRPLRPPRAPA